MSQPVVPENRMTRFVEDQVEAVKVAREERVGEAVSHRVDACHLAMRYLDTFESGQTQTVARVLDVAHKFEAYLTAP